MAGAFRIAEGFVEVTADESGYDRTMERLRAKRHQVGVQLKLDDRDARTSLDRFTRDRSMNVRVNLDQTALSSARFRDFTASVLPELQEAARRRAEDQLRFLARDRTVRIIADLDTQTAAADLALLTRPRTARVTADADTRAAADDLNLLARPRTATVNADADTGAAAARLDALARDRRVNIRVDVDRAGLGALSRIGGGGGIGVLSSSVARLAALALTALPAVASLGQSIVAMGPAAAVAVPAVLSLGAAFTAIKLGTSGIGDAFKAAFAPAVSSGSAAAASTNRVADAQRALARAQQGVKDAEERAAEARVAAARQIEDAQRNLKSTVQDVADANQRAAQQVAGAERDLADAQEDARQAQLDLTAARKEAAEGLEDLNNRLEDAQLDQRQKVLDLHDAEQELAAARAKGGKAGEEDFDKAQLRYDRAVQNLQEQQTETARLQQQADDANRAGVEGSKTVTAAKQQIADANQQLADKTQQLRDAEMEQARTATDGLQKIALAERDVADARAAAAKAAQDGARDIADAQAAVADAARGMAAAQTAGAAATNKVADAMARLAPNAREFVSAVIAQAGAWRGLKLDVQNTLFAGLGQKFTTMSTSVLPSLRQGLTGTAGVLNQMAKGAFDAVTNLGKTGQLRQMFAGLNAGLAPLVRIPGQFLTGLTQLSIAASPAFARLAAAAAASADGISQRLATAFKSGALEESINRGIEIAKQFGALLGDVFGTLGNIMKAAGAAGGDALGALGSVFAELRRVTAMPEVQKAMTSIFEALAAVGKLIAGTLGAAIEAVMPLLAAIAPIVTELAQKFGPVLADLAAELGKALTPIISALLPVAKDLGNVLVQLVRAVMPLLEPLGALIGEIIKAFAPYLKTIGAQLVMVVQSLAGGLEPIITALVPVVGMFGQFLAALAPLFPQILQAILPLVPSLAQLAVSLLKLAMEVLTPLLPLIVKLAGLFTGALTWALEALVPKITMVIGWVTAFADKVTEVVHWIVDKFQWLYDKLVGHSIIPDLVRGIIGWFTQLWTRTKEIFTALKNWVVNTWNGLWNSVRNKWNSFWSGLRTAVSGAWKSFKDSVTGLRASITNTWNGMWNSARDKVTSIFGTIRGKISDFKSAMTTAFSTLRDGLGKVWDGIKSKIASPVRYVVNTVYNNGIRRMWNSIAGKISSKISLPQIKLGFNKGGVVPGTGNSDTVPAMLTPGERILSNQQVAALGGHRGIDAMLGQDRPTKTGGNPSPQQERRRYQGPTQHYAEGGIIGKVTGAIGGAVSSATSWAKDIVVGGLKSAASKALSALVRPLINRIPASGIGNLMRGLANKAVDGMMGWFTNEDKKAVGGPAVQKALAWAKTQHGKNYQWGGNGNPSWDCSGLTSAIESVIRGERPHRRWATGSFVGNNGPAGWVRNLNSPYMIGITNSGVGHTAGTLAGVNVESRGGDGVVIGKRARSYRDPMFTSRWGFAPAAKYDSGGLLQPGATMAINKTGRPERVLSADETAMFEQLLRQGGGTTVTVDMTVNTMTVPTPAERKRFATAMADDIKEAIRKSDRSRI